MTGASVATLAAVVLLFVTGAAFLLMTARRKPLTDAESEPLGLYVPALQLGMTLTVLVAAATVAQYAAGHRGITPLPSQSGEVVQFSDPSPDPAVRSAHYAALLDTLSGLPDVEAAGLANPGMSLGLGPVDGITTDCGRCSQAGLPTRFKLVRAIHQFVSPDTFRALGTTVVEGRGFTDEDRMGTDGWPS